MPRETTTSCGRYESRIHRRVTGWFYQQLRLAVRSPRERPWPLAALSSNSGSGNDSIETRPAWISRVGHATLRGIASRSLVRSQRGPPTLQIRASTCQQFQDVVGQAGHAEAVRLSPGPSSPARPGRAVPARSPRQDDRLGEVVVVRVAGCRRDLRDAVRVRFGDLPSRLTLLHVSEELARRDAGMRRRARRFTSFAPTDTVVRLQSREAADAETRKDRDLHPIRTLREQTPWRWRLV